MTPAEGQRRSDLEALDDLCNVIGVEGRHVLMAHALDVIECMGSLGRAATLEHASLMVDHSLKAIRALCEFIGAMETKSIADSHALDAREKADHGPAAG